MAQECKLAVRRCLAGQKFPNSNTHHALQVPPAVMAASSTSAISPAPAPNAIKTNSMPVTSKAGIATKNAEAKLPGRPAPKPKQVAEHSQGENAMPQRHVPAYMKPTASVRAKDARDQQAKIAASRIALAEKKWNRA